MALRHSLVRTRPELVADRSVGPMTLLLGSAGTRCQKLGEAAAVVIAALGALAQRG